MLDCTAKGAAQPASQVATPAADSCDDLGPPPPSEEACFERPCQEYAWVSSDWTSCSVACGGGTQNRTVVCMDRLGRLVSAQECTATGARLAPPTGQACNSVPCPQYGWALLSDWGACSAACGAGVRTRPVACVADGNVPVSSALCQGYPRPATIEACSSSCDTPYWNTTAWSRCSASCGGGMRSRSATCYVGGAPAAGGDSQCLAEGLAPQAISDRCNTWLCETFALVVGAWGPCNVSCGGGYMTRSALCISSVQGSVALSFCSGGGVAPLTGSACGMAVCDPCSALPPCNGHGSCGSGGSGSMVTRSCTCDSGYSGIDCGQAFSCQNGQVTDVTGNCCDGVRDFKGTCCARPSRLDACGICNGSSVVVDAGGACCPGLLDAGGLCCKSGRLDACGVCDGSGTTCGINVVVRLAANLSAVGGDFSGKSHRERDYVISSSVH